MNKKIKSKYKLNAKLDLAIYETHINIGMCSNSEELEDWYSSLTGDTSKEHYPSAALTFNETNGDHWIIFTHEHYNLNACAHECFHMTHRIMDGIDTKFNLHDHEPFAWLNGYLVDTIYIIGNDLKKKLSTLKTNKK